MGAISSKSVLEDMKTDNLSQVNTTPNRVLPFDPRSPSGNVSRTPISVMATPNGPKNETPKARPVKSLLLDPRSPLQVQSRTPIQIETDEKSLKYQPLKASKLAEAIPLLPDECKTAQVAKDPRSPTDNVPRTPLQEDLGLDSLCLKEIEKENSEESAIVLDNTLPVNDKNDRLEFNTDPSQENERRPLTCVHNQKCDEPRSKLQAKQCRSLEDEFTKNEKNILNKLKVAPEENESNSIEKLPTATDFVQDI